MFKLVEEKCGKVIWKVQICHLACLNVFIVNGVFTEHVVLLTFPLEQTITYLKLTRLIDANVSIIGNTIISFESFFLWIYLFVRGIFIQTKSEFGSPYFVYSKPGKIRTLIFARNINAVVKNALSECSCISNYIRNYNNTLDNQG